MNKLVESTSLHWGVLFYLSYIQNGGLYILKIRNMSQRIIALFTILLLVTFQVATFFPQQVDAAALANGVTISVEDQDGNKIYPLKALEIEEGQTAFDLIKEINGKLGKEYFNYSVHEEFGAFINSIGDVTPEGDKYWGFIVNGEEAPVGVSQFQLTNGDNIRFKLIEWPSKKVNVKVSAKDGDSKQIIDKTVQVVEGSSAYDALKLAGEIAEVKVDSAIDQTYFAFINNIADMPLGKNDYWSTSINDGYMSEGLSSYIVKEGDQLSLEVITWTPPTEEDEPTPDTGNEPPADEEVTSPDPIQTPEDEPMTVQVKEIIQATTQYVAKNNSDDFSIVALKAAGGKIPLQYIDRIKNDLITNEGYFRNVTDYERTVLGLTAAGKDATDFAGYNLIEKIYSNERMTNQGNNGVIYALLAYDSGNYLVPDDAEWTRESLVNYLLDVQLEDGSWSLFGSTPSADITGMALAALAPYKEQATVQAAIDKAVEWIASNQDPTGGFSSDFNGGDSSETTAQIIIGLSTVDEDPTGERFTKRADEGTTARNSSTSEGVNLIQHLLTFKQSDGGFAHLIGDGSNGMASTQALLALAAYDRIGEGSIYQFIPGENEEDPIDEEKPPAGNEEDPIDEEEPQVPGNEENSLDEEEPSVIPDQNPGNKNVTPIIETPETLQVIPVNNKETEKALGKQLPDTATPYFNMVAAGGTLLVIGSSIFVYATRRQTNN